MLPQHMDNFAYGDCQMPNGARGQTICTNALLNYLTRCDSVEQVEPDQAVQVEVERTSFYLLIVTLFLKKYLTN